MGEANRLSVFFQMSESESGVSPVLEFYSDNPNLETKEDFVPNIVKFY